jgi:hypothetical protein
MQPTQFWFSRFIPLLFLPPGSGLLFHSATSATLAERLLALALALFCPELAHMAQVDLDNIAAILRRNGYTPLENSFASVITVLRQPPSPFVEPDAEDAHAEDANTVAQRSSAHLPEDSRLNRFYKVTTSTIVLEIVGFYLALLSLQWGALLIILSQIWFNLLAAVQLHAKETPAVVSFGIADRQAVLVANAIGFGLLCSWPIEAARTWLASGLLVLIVLFLIMKYGVVGLRSGQVD